jgi:predicted amidohydrolase
MKRVAVVQTDPVFGELARNLEAARALTAGLRADVIVFPELFSTGYQFASRDEVCSLAESAPGGPTVAALEAIARESGATVVGGLPEKRDGTIYNAAAIVYPSGFLMTYRKAHLFSEESAWFAPGPDLPPVIRTPQGVRLGVMICFDWRFPEVARHLALEGADLIAHPSNLVRPHGPAAMVTRALENRVYAATANRVGAEARGGRTELRFIGCSQIVSPQGERLAGLGETGTGLALAEIDLSAARSKRVTGGDDLFLRRRGDLFGAPLPERSRGPSRFVILRHEGGGAGHFDLLFELCGRLLAFRADSIEPLSREVERNFDHRREYLEKEGDLGGGRGTLRRADEGTCRVEAFRDEVRIEACGRLLCGRIVFREVKDERWSAEVEK